jgi:polyisoprenoid-binding protein YceI
MRKLLCVAALTGLFCIPGHAADGKTWKLDPDHSDAHFQVRHLGITNIQGDFPGLSGTAQIDDDDLSKSTLTATIEVASIYTRVKGRDDDLKSPNFFDVTKFPTMTFRSTKIQKTAPGKAKMTGMLTLHGVSKEVTFDVDGPTAPITFMGQVHRGATATTTIDRRDFGITMEVPGISAQVAITLDVDLMLAK